MGLILSKGEFINKTYRNLTGHELTLCIYTKCKNNIAQLLFPTKDRNSIYQEDVNRELNMRDYRGQRIPIVINNKKYKIPLDLYLIHLYRYSELTGNSLINNMERVMYDYLIGNKINKDSVCVKRLFLSMDDDIVNYKFGQIEGTTNDKYFKQVVCPELIEVYRDCKYGVLVLSTEAEIGKHRTIMFVENVDSHLTFHFYDPHGSGYTSFGKYTGFVSKLREIFNDMNKFLPDGVMSVSLNEENTRCFYGIQKYTEKYDYGLCQLFSAFWIYNIIKIISDAENSNVILPKTSEWIYLIDEYYTTEMLDIQTYNAVLLFGLFLIKLYSEQNPSYRKELNNFEQSIKKYYKIEKYKE